MLELANTVWLCHLLAVRAHRNFCFCLCFDIEISFLCSSDSGSCLYIQRCLMTQAGVLLYVTMPGPLFAPRARKRNHEFWWPAFRCYLTTTCAMHSSITHVCNSHFCKITGMCVVSPRMSWSTERKNTVLSTSLQVIPIAELEEVWALDLLVWVPTQLISHVGVKKIHIHGEKLV